MHRIKIPVRKIHPCFTICVVRVNKPRLPYMDIKGSTCCNLGWWRRHGRFLCISNYFLRDISNAAQVSSYICSPTRYTTFSDDMYYKMIHGPYNIKLITVQQAKIIRIYENIKMKLYKCIAAIWRTCVMNKTQSLENFVYLVGLHIYYKTIHSPYNIKSKSFVLLLLSTCLMRVPFLSRNEPVAPDLLMCLKIVASSGNFRLDLRRRVL